jgi:hypothetical protein
MLAKILPHNESNLDRGLRVALGVALLAMVFVGPATLWGLVGISSCPVETKHA